MDRNTLESGNGGAFSMGWGCPLEIQRRDELLKLKQSTSTLSTNDMNGTSVSMKEEVERILTNERYERIRKIIFNEMEMEMKEINNNDTTINMPIDFFLFQEMIVDNSWDENNENDNDNENGNKNNKFPPSSYERVPCQDNNEKENKNQQKNLQRIYVRKQSGWKSKQSYTLQSDVLEGGCLVEFGFQNDTDGVIHEGGDKEEQTTLFLVNLHGKSKNMRDPKLRRTGLTDLWDEIGVYLNNNNLKKDNNSNQNGSENDDSWWMKRIILCGDWNTQLSDLIPPEIQYNNNNNMISSPSLEPVVGLLHNSTTFASTTANSITATVPVYSTNHEDGFLAQYDGCLFFRSTSTNTSSNHNHNHNHTTDVNDVNTATATATATSSSSFLELDNVSWNITGFMPKGQNGRLPSSSSNDDKQEHNYYNNFTYSRKEGGGRGVYLNGIFLGPDTLPSIGMSDHIRIYTTIRINNIDGNDIDNSTVNNEQPQEQEHQRRPLRRQYYYNNENSTINSSYDDDSNDK
jgi:hypothetical protein